MPRPTTVFAWATDPGTRLASFPSAPRQATGWLPNEPNPALSTNALLGNLFDWATYLSELSPTDGDLQVDSIATPLLNITNAAWTIVHGSVSEVGTDILVSATTRDLQLYSSGRDVDIRALEDVLVQPGASFSIVNTLSAGGVQTQGGAYDCTDDTNGRRFGYGSGGNVIERRYSAKARGRHVVTGATAIDYTNDGYIQITNDTVTWTFDLEEIAYSTTDAPTTGQVWKFVEVLVAHEQAGAGANGTIDSVVLQSVNLSTGAVATVFVAGGTPTNMGAYGTTVYTPGGGDIDLDPSTFRYQMKIAFTSPAGTRDARVYHARPRFRQLAVE